VWNKITTSKTTKNPQPSTKPNTENWENSVQKIHIDKIQERNNTKNLDTNIKTYTIRHNTSTHQQSTALHNTCSCFSRTFQVTEVRNFWWSLILSIPHSIFNELCTSPYIIYLTIWVIYQVWVVSKLGLKCKATQSNVLVNVTLYLLL
jgi:hypothetical protein